MSAAATSPRSGRRRGLAPFHFQRPHRRFGLLLALGDDRRRNRPTPRSPRFRAGARSSASSTAQEQASDDGRRSRSPRRADARRGRAAFPARACHGQRRDRPSLWRANPRAAAKRRRCDSARGGLDRRIVGERKPDALARRSARRSSGDGCRPRRGRTTPSSTVSASAAIPKAAAARATRKCRACAAARRKGMALNWIVSLAIVGPCSGATPVSPSTMETRVERHVQFLRDDLGKRGADAGAEIDMAVEGGHLAPTRPRSRTARGSSAPARSRGTPAASGSTTASVPGLSR